MSSGLAPEREKVATMAKNIPPVKEEMPPRKAKSPRNTYPRESPILSMVAWPSIWKKAMMIPAKRTKRSKNLKIFLVFELICLVSQLWL